MSSEFNILVNASSFPKKDVTADFRKLLNDKILEAVNRKEKLPITFKFDFNRYVSDTINHTIIKKELKKRGLSISYKGDGQLLPNKMSHMSYEITIDHLKEKKEETN